MRIRTHTNPLNITHRFNTIKLPSEIKELDIEIGFGKGIFLLNWAKQNPNHHVIGLETRKQMVELLEKKLNQENLPNTTIFHGNGHYFINDATQDNSISRIFIFHPDPWFKSKHHKRRIITTNFVELALKKLKPNGKIYVSTDVKALFEDMQTQFKSFNKFKKKDDPFWETTYQTHWSKFSITDQRDCFIQTYEKTSE